MGFEGLVPAVKFGFQQGFWGPARPFWSVAERLGRVLQP